MRPRVFALTWLAYASAYLARKNFAVSKARLGDELRLDARALGDVDTGYLGAYALGQFLWGALGDRLGPRRIVGWGLVGAAIACAAAGGTSGFALLAAAWAVNGLLQATGWSGNVKAIGGFITPAERGRVMGLWSTCYQVGGLLATSAAGFALGHWGWRWAFRAPAIPVLLVGLAVLALLPWPPPAPAGAGAPPDQGSTDAPGTGSRTRRDTGTGAGASRDGTRIWRSPALWRLGGAYFFLKLIRYSLLFWLPYYLVKQLGYADHRAAYLSVAFEMGGTVGSIAVGLASDRVFGGHRRPLAALMTAALGGALLLYSRVSAWGVAPNFAAMALVGFCLFGPDTLVSGAAAQDLGGPGRTAAAAGFINGLGSLGAILQGRLTSTVATRWGWPTLFTVLVAMAGAAALVLALPNRRPRHHEPRLV